MRLAAMVLVLSACAELPDAPAACAIEVRHLLPISRPAALDLLFVVDRTPSMAASEDALRLQVPELASVLDQLQGGLPDLHVAVVTTDLGGDGVSGCAGRGDGGSFVGGTRCGLGGSFLRDDGRGTRNYPGTLGEALTCLVDAPLATCPVSQPLAAIVAALDGSERANDGFRRPYADLAIIVITDGDDCSLADPGALAGLTDEAAVDARCATPGAGLADVDATTRYLRSILSDEPDRLVLATISGDPSPRLRAASLSDRTVHHDVNDASWADVLVTLPRWWYEGGNPCLDERVDLAPEVPGFQVECSATLLRWIDGEPTPYAVVPWCHDPDRAPDEPCLRLVRNELQCPLQPASLAFALEHDPHTLPLGSALDVRCAATCR